MVHRSNIHELKILNAIFITFFFIFLACFADLSWSQRSETLKAGVVSSALARSR